MFRFVRLCVAVSLLVVLAPSLHAQMASEIKGRITDVEGAALASAAVKATEVTTHLTQTGKTTSEGYYIFAHLVPGIYQIDVDADGFRHATRSGITVMIGQTVGVDIALSVGEQQQTITVHADAPLLQSQTSSIQMSIPAATVVAIPLNTRNFVQLSTLVPGVALPPGTLLPRINGGRPRTNEYLFDGISALQPEPGQVAFFPILDDIQEFTVETDNVSAEFGRFNGGVVNVATRYGTNQFHGSLFEYFRNEALNARNYFSKTPARKPAYRRNLFGATLGGPILRDRLFFFGDYQGVKQRIGVTRISTLPTLAMRQGIFTGVSNIYDPLRRRWLMESTSASSFRIMSSTGRSILPPSRCSTACPRRPISMPLPITTAAPVTTMITRINSISALMARSVAATALLSGTPTTTKWSSR